MSKRRKALVVFGAVAAATATGYVLLAWKNAWEKRETEQDIIENEDEQDFFEDEDDLFGDEPNPFEDDQNGEDKEDTGLFLMPNQADYMNYSLFLMKKLGNEIRDRSKEMYTLISRRNIKAEEKEKRLKDMSMENMDACHQIVDSADGMLGMIHTGLSEDFTDYLHVNE